jgi:hypothetical protein
MSRAASGVASREGWLPGGPAASSGRPGEETTGVASGGKSWEAAWWNGWAGTSAWPPRSEGHCREGSGEVMSTTARGRERDARASESRGRGEGTGDPRVGGSGCIWLIVNGELGKWLLL